MGHFLFCWKQLYKDLQVFFFKSGLCSYTFLIDGWLWYWRTLEFWNFGHWGQVEVEQGKLSWISTWLKHFISNMLFSQTILLLATHFSNALSFQYHWSFSHVCILLFFCVYSCFFLIYFYRTQVSRPVRSMGRVVSKWVQDHCET